MLDHLLADQQWLEGLLVQMRTASVMRDRTRADKLRNDLEGDLSAHIKAEEVFLMPALLRSDRHAARTLRQEHDQLRGRLAELRAGSDLIPVDVLDRFMVELRSHARLVSETGCGIH